MSINWENEFQIRYSINVTKRMIQFWRKVSATLKFFSFLSVSAGFAMLINGNEALTAISAIVFASLQAIDFAINPADRIIANSITNQSFKDLWVMCSQIDDGQFSIDYKKILAESTESDIQAIRRIAYNDTVLETGADNAFLYPNSILSLFC